MLPNQEKEPKEHNSFWAAYLKGFTRHIKARLPRLKDQFITDGKTSCTTLCLNSPSPSQLGRHPQIIKDYSANTLTSQSGFIDKNKLNIRIGEKIMKVLTSPAQVFLDAKPSAATTSVDRQLGF